MWKVVAEYSIGASFWSAEETKEIMEIIGGSGMSAEMTRELLEVRRTDFRIFNILVKSKEGYGNSLEKFKIFVELAKKSEDKTEALAKLNRVYGDDIDKLRRVRDLLLRVEDGGKASSIGRQADVIGDDYQKLEIFVESVEKNGSWLFNELAEIFSKDKEKLRKLAEITEGTNSVVNHWARGSLLKHKDLIRDIRTLEILLKFAKHEKSFDSGVGSNVIEDIAKAIKDWGWNIEMLEIIGGMISVEDKHLLPSIMGVNEAYGNNPKMLKVFVDVAKETEDWQSIQRLGTAREAYGNSEEMLKIIKEALQEFGGEGSLFAAIVGAKPIYGNDLEMLRAFMEVARGEPPKTQSKYKEELEVFKEFIGAATCEDHPMSYSQQVDYMQAFGATMPICGGDIELIKIFREMYGNSREYRYQDGFDSRPLTKEKERYGRDKVELGRVMLSHKPKKEIIENIVSLGIDSEIARTIAEVSEEVSPRVAIPLLEALDAYKDNPDIFSVFKDLAKSPLEEDALGRAELIDELGKIGAGLESEIRLEELQKITEIGKTKVGVAIALINARRLYKNQIEVFNIFEDLAKSPIDKNTRSRMISIDKLAEEYERIQGEESLEIQDEELLGILRECAETAKTRPLSAVALFKAWKSRRDEPEIFRILKGLAESPLGEKGDQYRAIFISAFEEQSKEVKSGNGLEVLRECVQIAENKPKTGVALFKAWKTYKDEPEIFNMIKALATSQLEEKEEEDKKVLLMNELGESSEVIKCKRGKERLTRLIGLEGGAELITKKIRSIRNAQPLFEDDEERFNIIYGLANENKLNQIKLLILGEEVIKGDTEMLKASIEVVETLEEKTFRQLIGLQNSYKGNVELFRRFAANITGYLTCTKILDAEVLKKYADIVEKEGEQNAREYIENLSQTSKGLVSSGVPEEQREVDEYQYLVRYVFPDGNYSNYESNLACGDQMEHVEGYQFNREGYPVILTGLKGYVVKEGATPDDELIKEYTERLGGIREFVSSRGPDNKALQEAFTQKIDKVFDEKGWEEFKGIEELTVEEKMLCLFLGEAVRRGQKGAGSQADAGICDLIIEYKYAFHEDLEAYIQRSADQVKSQKDKAGQDYMLLSELSTIYGENVKHLLRHSILEKLDESKNKDRIVSVFSNKIGQEVESADLSSQQWQRVENTFQNTRIPEDKRFDVLYKQIYRIFGSNIKFETKEEETELKERITAVMKPLQGEFSLEKFKSILPELFKTRNLYRSGINGKLQELFTQDINKIFEEIAKYEEDIEQEAKETTMGGKKNKEVKKSSKKRNIRGFFTKNAEGANARMGAYLCIAGDESMWKNKNYFEFILVDEETNKCVGTVMLLNIEAENGKKYLWFGPNPFESFLDVVSSEACYNFMHQTICEFASENGFDGVVVPSKDEQILGQCTNRGGDFPGFIKESRLKDEKGKPRIVPFGKQHKLSSRYGYSEGALVWER